MSWEVAGYAALGLAGVGAIVWGDGVRRINRAKRQFETDPLVDYWGDTKADLAEPVRRTLRMPYNPEPPKPPAMTLEFPKVRDAWGSLNPTPVQVKKPEPPVKAPEPVKLFKPVRLTRTIRRPTCPLDPAWQPTSLEVAKLYKQTFIDGGYGRSMALALVARSAGETEA
jgi:hypothetical protein